MGEGEGGGEEGGELDRQAARSFLLGQLPQPNPEPAFEFYPWLLVPERNHGINLHRTPCRDIRREQDNTEQNGSRAKKCHRVARGHAV
jgi:hypothetical protein